MIRLTETGQGQPHDPSHLNRRHICRRHCVAADTTSKRPIARSCPARAGAVGADVGTTTVYRVATELRVRDASQCV